MVDRTISPNGLAHLSDLRGEDQTGVFDLCALAAGLESFLAGL